MDLEKKYQERRTLLEKMRDSLQEELIACDIIEPEEYVELGARSEKIPPMLRVILDSFGEDGVIGDFFFQPFVTDEDAVQFFSAVLTLADEIEKERLPELYKKISDANFQLPCGAYCIDEKGGFLVFKLTVPLSVNISDEALLEQMNIVASNAIMSADLFADKLI